MPHCLTAVLCYLSSTQVTKGFFPPNSPSYVGSASTLSKKLMRLQDEKIQKLVEKLGDDDFGTRRDATEELGKKIKEDPGKTVVQEVQKLADKDDLEVAWRVKLLVDIQTEKDELETKKHRLKKINDTIKKWEDAVESADPSTDQGWKVVQSIHNIEKLVSYLKDTVSKIKSSIEDEEEALRKKPG